MLIGAAVAGVVVIALVAFVATREDGDAVAADEAVDTTATTATTLPRKTTTTLRRTTTTTTTVTTTTSIGPPAEITPRSVTASSTDANGTDECQPPNDTSFAAANLFDGINDTAWRVDGNATGATLDVAFDGPMTLSSIGLVPGYDKRDPCSGVDRFPQGYRISAVTYTFDDGTTESQAFTDSPTLQTVPVDVTTSRVLITITGVREPQYPVGSEFRRDKTAISEMVVIGTAR